MEVVAVRHPFDGYFSWHFPPSVSCRPGDCCALMPYVSRLCAVDSRTLPALSSHHPRHRRRAHWLSPRRSVSRRAMQFHRRATDLSRRLLSGGLLFIERPVPCLPACCSACSPTSRISACSFRLFWRTAGTGASFAAAEHRLAGARRRFASLATVRATDDLGGLLRHSIGHTSQAFLSDGWADFGKITNRVPAWRARLWRLGAAGRGCVQGALAALRRRRGGRDCLWRSACPSTRLKAAALGCRRPAGDALSLHSTTWWVPCGAAGLSCGGSAARTGFCQHEVAGIGAGLSAGGDLPARRRRRSVLPRCWSSRHWLRDGR